MLTQAVLPGMLERGEGAVINVASLLAFSGAWDRPTCRSARSTRPASRSSHLHEILAGELRDSGVRVQVVCPGVVRSEFHTRQGLDMSEVPRMEPATVVEASLADLERGVVSRSPEHRKTLRCATSPLRRRRWCRSPGRSSCPSATGSGASDASLERIPE